MPIIPKHSNPDGLPVRNGALIQTHPYVLAIRDAMFRDQPMSEWARHGGPRLKCVDPYDIEVVDPVEL